jgi:hypothetical protein
VTLKNLRTIFQAILHCKWPEDQTKIDEESLLKRKLFEEDEQLETLADEFQNIRRSNMEEYSLIHSDDSAHARLNSSQHLATEEASEFSDVLSERSESITSR